MADGGSAANSSGGDGSSGCDGDDGTFMPAAYAAERRRAPPKPPAAAAAMRPTEPRVHPPSLTLPPQAPAAHPLPPPPPPAPPLQQQPLPQQPLQQPLQQLPPQQQQQQHPPPSKKAPREEPYPHVVPPELTDLRRANPATPEFGVVIVNALKCLTAAQVLATSLEVESAAEEWYTSHPNVPYINPHNPDPLVLRRRFAEDIVRVPMEEYERIRPVSNFVSPHWAARGRRRGGDDDDVD